MTCNNVHICLRFFISYIFTFGEVQSFILFFFGLSGEHLFIKTRNCVLFNRVGNYWLTIWRNWINFLGLYTT